MPHGTLKLSILLTSLLLLSVSVACGDGDDGSSPPPTPDTSSNNTNNPQDADDNNTNNGDDAGDDTQGDDTTPDDSSIPDVAPDVVDDLPPADTSDDVAADTPVVAACTLGGTECESTERRIPAGLNESLVCRPTGSLAAGDDCNPNADDCGAAAMCVMFDATHAKCESICNAHSACPETYQVCLPWFGTGGAVAGICLGDVCTPPSTGCGTDERCSILDSPDGGFYACLPAGDVAIGGDCSNDNCQAGGVCVQTSTTDVCRALCNAGADCGSDDLHCAWSFEAVEDYGLCQTGCDPVRQTGCTAGNSCCYANPEDGSTECYPTGALTEAEDCSNLSLCAAGLDCVKVPGTTVPPHEYFCRAYCDADNTCTTGTCTTTEATAALKFCMP